MSSTPVPYNYEDLMLAPPPAVSQDLWVETTDGKARKALRAVSDDVLARGSLSIQIGLPRKILELTDLIDRSTNDESSIFHEKWDTRWLSQMRSPVSSPTANMSSFSLIGVSTNGMPVKDAVIVGDGSTTTTTTTRRFSISQHGLADISVPSSISVYRPPTHILQLWEFLESQIRHVIELFDAVQMFLILKTPVAEEGNNTGVEIQQQCARTLVDARRFVLGCENYLKLYHSQRAKLASKCIKYPQLEDYQRALVERDHEECRDCRYLLVRLRMQCVAVADVLHKNFDKVGFVCHDPKLNCLLTACFTGQRSQRPEPWWRFRRNVLIAMESTPLVLYMILFYQLTSFPDSSSLILNLQPFNVPSLNILPALSLLIPMCFYESSQHFSLISSIIFQPYLKYVHNSYGYSTTLYGGS
ncbi:hypothetical protein Pst134EB_027555 [Puccinia striiformis f. sp. tritici]|nr:hypothetical protein Pst134EB_027555 [Puccinia striiformis f. sp. tritici]